MKVLYLLPAAMAMQVSEEHGTSMNMKNDLEGMKELFLGISKTKIDQTTRAAVEKMMGDICTTLGEAVTQDMATVAESLDCKFDNINACATTRATNKDEYEIATLDQSSEDDRQSHRTCRGTEQDFCNTRNQEKGTCDARAAAIARCHRPAADAFDAALPATKTWFDCIHAQIGAAKDLCETHDLYSQACKDKERTRVECEGKQTAFEIMLCNWQTKVDELCWNYDTCYESTVKLYEEEKKIALEKWEVATTQMESLTTLKCYGNSILENKTSLAHCENLPCQGCPPSPCDEHCPDKPTPVPCSEREGIARPCEQTFLDAEYNTKGMDSESCTPAIECQTCHDFHADGHNMMYMAGRGQCLCPDGNTKDTIEEAPLFNFAEECTAWCLANWKCRAASWNADTHECIGLESFGSITSGEPTPWSCFTSNPPGAGPWEDM